MTTTNVAVPTIDEMATDKYQASFVWVTPEIAKSWLGKNLKNRNISKGLVERYRRDMDAGDWAFTGEAVKFSAEGTLLDAQHRLHAVILHGQPVLMLIVRGLDKAAQDVMDTGRRRTAADMLAMHEEPNASLTAATARLAVAYNEGRIKTSESQYVGEVTNSQVLALVEADPFITWAVHTTRTIGKTLPANPAAVAFAAWLTGKADPQSTIDFLSAVAEMRTDGIGDPRYTLLRRLQVARDQRERLTSVQQAWLITRAWDAWRSGDKLRQLKMSTSAGPQAFINPVTGRVAS